MTVVAITKLGITSGRTEATERTRLSGMFDLTVIHPIGTAIIAEIIVTNTTSRNVWPIIIAVLGRQTRSNQPEPTPTERTKRYATGIKEAIATAAASVTKNAGGRLPMLGCSQLNMSPNSVKRELPRYSRLLGE